MVSKKLFQERKSRLQEVYGKTCVICGRDGEQTVIVYHNIKGDNHESFYSMSNLDFELTLESGLYVPMCRTHHNLLHRLLHTKIFNCDNFIIVLRLLCRFTKKESGALILNFLFGFGSDLEDNNIKIFQYSDFERDIEKI